MRRSEGVDAHADADIVASDEIAPADQKLGAIFTKPIMESVRANLVTDAGAPRQC